jgi:hypothetical protein
MCRKLMYLFSFALWLGLILTSAAEAIDPSLVLYLPFHEGTGEPKDFSVYKHGVELVNNPNWVDGKYGKALEFDGTNYVRVPINETLQLRESFTVEFWVKREDSQPATWNYMVAGGTLMWAVIVNADQNVYVWSRSGGTWGQRLVTSIPLTTDWTHIALTYDVGSGVELYFNGEKAGEGGTPPVVDEIDGSVMVGARNPGQEFFAGIIDEVALYNRILTLDEIRTDMEAVGEPWPYALGPTPPDGALHEDTWVNLSWSAGDFAVSHDVYLGDNFGDVNVGAESTFQGNQVGTFYVVGFPGFAYPEGLVPGTTYYWRVDEVNDTDPNSPWKGDVWSFMIPPKTAYAPEPADAAEQVDPDANLSWTAGFSSKLHTVYFADNFDEVNNAAGGLPQGAATYDPGTLRLAQTYYWRVDEFDIVETHKGDIWSFTTEGAVGNPNPANGAVDVKQTQIITWSPNVFAASHEVYFGADEDTVKNANTGSPEYKGTSDLGSETYDPGKLEWDTTYYWRIDEVNNANTDSPWTGILWSFTTANFLVVDDFESYNDLDPADPDSNRIFNAWIDGYDDPANGSLVGYETPPFAEQTIVHSGNQSMPLYYDNSVGYSEATLTLTYPRDWTENGVNKLTIWFRGDSDNAVETLYVTLNGSAVITHDNPNVAQINKWTEWNIDLQAFADQGVNLANVNMIALGLGNKQNPLAGGSGTMYFDDIRLYPPPPEPAP